MKGSIFRFTLDLQSAQAQISIPVTRADTARTWQISFSDGGQPFLFEDGFLAKLEIKRPTGTHMEEFCAIKERTYVSYSFSQNRNTAAAEGLHECAIILYGADGEVIGSPRFTMIVSERVISADDINLSDDDRTAIDAMIAAEAARAAAEIGRVNAEATRVSAEKERVRTMEQFSQILDGKQLLPIITARDEGKVLSVSGGVYALTEGAGIEVNPEGEAADTLTSVRIGGKIYALPVGGGAAEIDEYGGEALIEEEIGFTVDGVFYPADEGMTWAEWISSDYNTLGLTDMGDHIGGPDAASLYAALVNMPLLPSDTVVIGGFYTLISVTGVSSGGDASWQ